VEEICDPGVVGTLDVSAPYSTFLEVIVIDFLLDLFHDLGVDGESIDSL
jgi:hypothetical protein